MTWQYFLNLPSEIILELYNYTGTSCAQLTLGHPTDFKLGLRTGLHLRHLETLAFLWLNHWFVDLGAFLLQNQIFVAIHVSVPD